MPKTPAQLDAEIAEVLGSDDGTAWTLAKRDSGGFKPLGHYDLKGGIRIDGNVTQFWGDKSKARAAAKEIGWPMNSIWRVHTRFQLGYSLRHTHGGMLTKAEYQEIRARFAK